MASVCLHEWSLRIKRRFQKRPPDDAQKQHADVLSSYLLIVDISSITHL